MTVYTDQRLRRKTSPVYKNDETCHLWLCECVKNSSEAIADVMCGVCGGTGLGTYFENFDIDPKQPCPHPPGSLGKLVWLCFRYSHGLERLWNPEDAQLEVAPEEDDDGLKYNGKEYGDTHELYHPGLQRAIV